MLTSTVYREIYALLIFREMTVHRDFAKKILANCLVVYLYSDLRTPIVILEMKQRFSMEFCIRGFHVNRDVWNPNLQETLSCSR